MAVLGAAFTSSSIASFAVLGATQEVAADLGVSGVLLAGAFVSCVVLTAHEIVVRTRRSYCALGWRRQTPKGLLGTSSTRVAAALWGFDAGLGFTTYRVTNGWWLLVALVLAGAANPLLVGTVYGGVFAVGLLVRLHRKDGRSAPELTAPVRAVRGFVIALEAAVIVVWAVSPGIGPLA